MVAEWVKMRLQLVACSTSVKIRDGSPTSLGGAVPGWVPAPSIIIPSIILRCDNLVRY